MRVTIDRDLCENTGCCESVCPEDVFQADSKAVAVAKPEACTSCWICVDNCVAGAIDIG